MPVALVTVIIGLIVLITRSKAITQVVGYLMLENGIYLFGLTQSQRVPFLVEIGVLLDVFVGVFIMGIVVFHINREFDSMSAANLTRAARLTPMHDPARARSSIPAGRRRAGVLRPGGLARARCSVAAAIAHLALVLLLWIAPGHRALDGWLGDDALGRTGADAGQRSLPRGRALRGGLPSRGESARRARVRELHAGFPRRRDARCTQPAFRAALDRHGDDDARGRAADLPSPRSPLARGGLEVPRRSRPSASRSRCSACSCWRPRNRPAAADARSCWTT